MSGDDQAAPSARGGGGGGGLLRGNRSRSYGSLIRYPLSPVRQRRVEHIIQPGETLQGLALKYGVSMEQIKRANRLYTNDSIFLKKSLSIPVTSDLDARSNGVDLFEEDCEEAVGGSVQDGPTGSSGENKQAAEGERASDLTPVDFLKRLDELINQSKQAAAKGCQDAEKRAAALEAAFSSRTSDRRPLTRSQSVLSSSGQQQAPHEAIPLTITKLTKKVKEREDEIFEL